MHRICRDRDVPGRPDGALVGPGALFVARPGQVHEIESTSTDPFGTVSGDSLSAQSPARPGSRSASGDRPYGFADAGGWVDLSGGDHVDIKRDETSIGLRADPIASIEEFLCRAFVIVSGPKSLSGQGTSPKFGGVASLRSRSPWRASGL